MKIVTAAQMREMDRRTIAAGVAGSTLMERAGAHVADAVEACAGSLPGARITVVCGKGNNGGDGFVAARLLRKKRARVTAVLLAKPAELTGDAKGMYRRWISAAGRGDTLVSPTDERLRTLLDHSHVVVDALLGTGLSSDVTGPYRAAIEAINGAERPVVAVDLPSGLNADTGEPMGVAVRATVTVTFGHPKVGLYVGQGIDCAGAVRVGDIGIPREYSDDVKSLLTLLTEETVNRLLPRRPLTAHKGTFGHTAIIAGSVGKTGAAALAAQAALRIGSGLVTVATPSGVNAILESKLLEAMTIPMPETKAHTLARSGLERILAFVGARTAAAVGPGLSTHPETVELIHALIPRLNTPAVLDADALNALAGKTSLLGECKAPLVLTPHPGEMARLVEEATPATINADRLGVSTRFAAGRGVVVVLKGARTVIAQPDGQLSICPTGNPGMATGGTGDVLTGMIAGLMAQRLPAWAAARAGVFLHGLAGDLAAASIGRTGLLAGDVIRHIPAAITQVASLS